MKSKAVLMPETFAHVRDCHCARAECQQLRGVVSLLFAVHQKKGKDWRSQELSSTCLISSLLSN